jgi:hypothetical protein
VSERPRRAEEIEINPIEDGLVVYDPRRDRVHHLNPTASVVLELCTGEIDRAEIVSLVQAAYDLDEPPEREVGDCLRQLRDEGLVE